MIQGFPCVSSLTAPIRGRYEGYEEVRKRKLEELSRLTRLIDLYSLANASGALDGKFDAHTYNATCRAKVSNLLKELGEMSITVSQALYK